MASIGAVILLLVAAPVVLSRPTEQVELGDALLLAVTLVVAALTMTGRVPTRLLRWCWRAVAVLGLLLLCGWALLAPAPGQPLVYLFLSGLVGFAAAGWRRPGALVYTGLVAALPAVLALGVGAPGAAWLSSIAPLSLTNIGFVAIFAGVRSYLVRTWLAGYRATAEAIASARARAEGEERDRVAALIHDEVLSALLAVRDAPTAATTRAQASRAAELLARQPDIGEPGPVDLAGLLAATAVLARTTHPGPVALVPSVPPVPVTVPGEVAEALVGAAREALRNAVRHAGPGARITCDLTDDGDGPVTIVVADTGVGFDPARVEPHRLGLAVSIGQRMATLPGGGAAVSSRPGTGTRVTLTWERR